MNSGEKKAYARGYNNAASNRWPAHKPPIPPKPVIAELMGALKNLRDSIDGELAGFEENDPLNLALDPAISRADKALANVTAWLRSHEI